MPYPLDTELDLSGLGCEERYIISSHHRMRGRPHKSMWIITHGEEISCFINSINNNWRDGLEAWGLHIVDDALNDVGESDDNRRLKLAKFVDSNASSTWHGYPANYMDNSQDRPNVSILQSWVRSGLITKAKMSKIRLGQLCSL